MGVINLGKQIPNIRHAVTIVFTKLTHWRLDKYVSELCIRAARQTNALRRIVKYLSPECRITMYTAFIASNFNYCNIVWHFCGHTNSLKIEKVHKKSLNVVLNDYLSPYHILLEKVKRPTMYVSRMKSIGLEVFKCLHKCSPTYITDMFNISASPYDTRGGIKLIQPRVNSTRNGLKNFVTRVPKSWTNYQRLWRIQKMCQNLNVD